MPPTPIKPPPIVPGYQGKPTCPFCGNAQATPVTFTWWGGLLGPKMFSLVKCLNCKKQYNGKTGKSADKAILIYTLVGFGAAALILGLLVCGGVLTALMGKP